VIVYDLLCSNDHSFEGWFRSAGTFDSQVATGEVGCPKCGDISVRKAPSAPALVTSRGDAQGIAVRLREAMGALRQHVESTCEHVGERFPEEARRIHYGESEERPIYGEASPAEARELRQEGIDVIAIPWPQRQDS